MKGAFDLICWHDVGQRVRWCGHYTINQITIIKQFKKGIAEWEQITENDPSIVYSPILLSDEMENFLGAFSIGWKPRGLNWRRMRVGVRVGPYICWCLASLFSECDWSVNERLWWSNKRLAFWPEIFFQPSLGWACDAPDRAVVGGVMTEEKPCQSDWGVVHVGWWCWWRPPHCGTTTTTTSLEK